MLKRLMLVLAALMLFCTSAMAGESPIIDDYIYVIQTTPTTKKMHTGMAVFQLVFDSQRSAAMLQEMSEASTPIRAYSEKTIKKVADALRGVDVDTLQLAEITGISMTGDGSDLTVNINFITPFQEGQTIVGVFSATKVDFVFVPKVEADGSLTFKLSDVCVRYLIRTEDAVMAVFCK